MKLIQFTEAMIIFFKNYFLIKKKKKNIYKVAERFISLKKSRQIFGKIKSTNADMSNV